MRALVITLLFSVIMLPTAASAQELSPGDPCSTNDAVTRIGGPGTPNAYILKCNGTTWQSMINLPNIAGDLEITGRIISAMGASDGQVLKWNNSAGEWQPGNDQSGGGSLSDGDYGDITLSGSGATWTIDNSVVTFAKMQDMNQYTVIGRMAAGSGAPSQITAAGLIALLENGTATANLADGLNADLLDGMTSTDFVAVAGDTMTGDLAIQIANVGIPSAQGNLVLENADFHVDVISSSADTWGSSVNLIEGNGASNTDIWSMYRQTTGGTGNSSLHFKFGTNNTPSSNTSVVTISSAGAVSATSFSGDGSGLTGISADDADTLDGINSTQFLRSDVADRIAYSTNGTLYLGNSDGTGRPTLRWEGDSGDDAFIQHVQAAANSNYLHIGVLDDGSDRIYIGGGVSGNYTQGGLEIDADGDARFSDSVSVGGTTGQFLGPVEGNKNGSLVVRNNANTAVISLAGSTGTVTATAFVGDGSGLTNITAGTANDLSCTDCIGPTEITDSYVLNTSDVMSGTLQVNLLRVDGTRGIDNVGGDYGTIRTSGGGVGGWEGYSIDNRWVLMSNDNGADSYVGIYNDMDNEWAIRARRNNAVQLYYNGSEKLITTNTGISVTGTVAATAFSGDGSSLTGISADDADTVDGIHGGSFIRSDANDDVSAHTEWQDNQEVRLGNSADFRMFHNGTDTYMRSYFHGARWLLQGENAGGTNRALIYADPDADTDIYYAGSIKLETKEYGINVTVDDTSTTDGYRINGLSALTADPSDEYLRLNQNRDFTNGVYTPDTIRADDGFLVDGSAVINGSGAWVGPAITASDLSCTDCIGPTEITDSYIRNTGDTMSGNLTMASGNYLIGGGNNLRFRGGANDTTYDYTGWYSGTTRHAIMLWDAGWTGCRNDAADVCLKAEQGNDLTLFADDQLHIRADADIYINATGDDVDFSGDRILDFTRLTSTSNATMPRLILDSTGSGDNWSAQGAYISLGESGDLGAAALHMTYRGDGYGYIGSGAVSNAVPGSSYWRFDYDSNNIYTPDRVTIANSLDMNDTDVFDVRYVRYDSDERKKKDIVVLDSALEKISQIKGVSYVWRDEFASEQSKGKTHIGVIAQDVEKVFPELVHADEEGYKDVAYQHLVAPIIEAVKELWDNVRIGHDAQQAEIEALKTQNAALLERLDKMEQRLDAFGQ